MKIQMVKILLLLLTFLSQSWAKEVATSSVEKLSDIRCQKMRQLGLMAESAPVQCDRLRAVNFSYIDFQGGVHKNGELIVMDAVAKHVATIFERLFQLKFPIHTAQPILNYQGDDAFSMSANNTSAFNFRSITGKDNLSIHAYGLAIDINPWQNPFIEFKAQGNTTIQPIEGQKHLNRMKFRASKAKRRGLSEDVIDVFADNGFLYWGGFWDTPIDYQHFQVSRDMANLMATLPEQSAILFFDNYVKWYQSCKAMYPVAYSEYRVNDYAVYLQTKLKVKSLSDAYRKSPSKVVSTIESPFKRSDLCVKN